MFPELFHEHPRPEIRPFRPFGELSSLAVDEFPRLSQTDSGCRQLVRASDFYARLLLLHDTWRNELDTESLLVARLDVLLLDSGLAHQGYPPGNHLAGLVDAVSRETLRLPGMTYEDIVINNPASDQRTYTEGAVARSEADFYAGHRLIEDSFRHAINRLFAGQRILAEQGEPAIPRVRLLLGGAAADLRQATGITDTIGTWMPREHFRQFRRFLCPHPIRHLKGPSGAFSGSVPILDLLVNGEVPDPWYLAQNTLYFPFPDRATIIMAWSLAQRRESLIGLSARFANPEEISGPLSQVQSALREFRLVHFRAFAKQMDEGSDPSTSGEANPRDFLLSRIRKTAGR